MPTPLLANQGNSGRWVPLPDQFDPSRPVVPCRPAHILLVEDHRQVRDVMARALRTAGFVVSEAEGAETARRIMGEERIDGAVLDISLGSDMNGLELGRWLRHCQPGIPIIFVTGLSEWELPEQAPQDGLTHMLRKPFGAREIVSFVAAMLAPRRGLDGVVSGG